MTYFKSFEKTSKVVKVVFQEVLGGDETAKSLLQMIDNVESHQEYLWKYIDYGIRTPVFRNMQWIGYGPVYKGPGAIETPLLEVNTHLLKEYFQAWFTMIDLLKTKNKELKSSLDRFTKETGVTYDEGALGELRGGISAELKASYVLVDHGKPFLPFSIMQAPVVPSIIRLTASGDLYLFEENLIVDVKSGRLMNVESGRLPIYYFKKGALLSDLKKCRDISRLYGIRKGIGVIAEDEKGETIYFAIYVPWRRWGLEPLLYLESRKLLFLTYIHRRNFEIYGGDVHDNTLTTELEAFMLFGKRDPWTDSSNWEVKVYHYVKGRTRPSKEARDGKVEFDKKDERHYLIKVEVPIVEGDEIKYQGKEYLAFDLIHREETLKLPVLIEIRRR